VTDLAEPIPGVAPARRIQPARGYLLYLGAATLFSINGTVAKSLMLGGLGATHLSQLRVTGAAILMLAGLAVFRPATLRLRRAELPLLLVYGVLGVAATQGLYFISIVTLPIGVSLLVEFTSPLLITLWFRFALHHPTKRIVWVGLVAALGGLAVVARVWEGFTLDPGGFAAAVGACIALAVYFVTTDMQVRGDHPRDPVSLTAWGMAAAAVFWAVVQPLWTFPLGELAGSAHVLGTTGPMVPVWTLTAWIVVMGTVVPFSLVVLSMQHLRASQASTMGMVEPVIATTIAWVALGETLSPIQIAGGALLLGGVVLAERNR
jgi:drug/metabolite transporter (DMT)-like permease